MRRNLKLLVIACIIIMTLTVIPGCSQRNVSSSEKITEQAVSYLQDNVLGEDYLGEAQWSIIAIAGSKMDLDSTVVDKFYSDICDRLDSNHGVLSDSKYTEYAKTCIALTAIGKDCTNVEGYDLSERTHDYNFVTSQGINGPIYALIAINSCDLEVDNAHEYVQYLLDSEINGGGFSMMHNPNSKSASKVSAQIDITAMAVQALAFYMEDEEVKEVVDRAVDKLENSYDAGDYISSSESVSQMIIALTSIGIDPSNDDRFTKEQRSLADSLEQFACDDGGFAHIEGGDSDTLATEQALCALDAISMMGEGRTFYE